ncbi:MAG: TonB-dependent receptor plug domain-containing protein [Gemmatimonadota bacterium]|jgi:iron complex outermembrane receptor protein|nr:TonB-dependent receptor [Gemmatimonadota bacterium]
MRRSISGPAGPWLLALVFAMAHPASAQTPTRGATARDSVPRRIEGVVVKTRQAPTIVGGSGTVDISPDSLRTAPGVTLDQALRTVPFVTARANSRGETELSVRASDSRQPAIMLEGAPLSAGWDGRADPGLVPLTGAAGLRVTRAAPSLLLGPNVTSGVVEVSLLDDATEPRALLAAGGDATGGVTSRAVGTGRHVTEAGRLVYSGGLGFRQRSYLVTPGAFRDPARLAGGERTNSDVRQMDAFGALRWSNASGAYASAAVTTMRGNRGVIPEAHLAAPRFWRQPEADRAVTVVTAGTGALGTPVGYGSLQMRASLNQGHAFIQQFGNATYGTVTGSERGRDHTAALRLIGEHSWGSRGDVGLGVSVQQVDYRESLNAAAEQVYRQRLWSVGLETDYELTDGLQVAASAALDGFSTPKTGDKPAIGDRQAWAVRAGATQALGGGLTFNAAAINRSRFPSLRELYSGALGRFLPNPDLRPERLLGVETGISLARGAWRWQAIAFHQRLDDVILRVNLPAPSRLQQRVNRDGQRTNGLELLGAYATARHTLLADLTLQDARLLDPTQPGGHRQIEYQPKVRGSFTAVAPLVAGWRGTAAANLFGSQFCLTPVANAYERLPTTGRADIMVDRTVMARAGAALLRSLRVLVAVDNITDALNWDQCGLPQPGRVLRVGVELH